MAIEKIKISELTQTNTKGLVIVSVLEGGVYKTYSYDLNNITNAVKGATFAGFVQCTTYLGGYVNPFLDFGATDKFFYILKGNGIAGFLDDGGGQHTYTQTNVQTTIVYWNGSAYSSEVVADSSVTTGSEVLAPHYVRSGYSTMSGEAVEHFDLSRYPICVRTWQEFQDTLESGAQYINIYVAQDLTAPATSPTQISIADTTEVININGCNVIDVDGLVLDSISRSESLRIVVNNTMTLKSTYNPLDYTGDKGSITFNIDQDVDMYIGGEVSGNFVELTNTQAIDVTIHGNIIEEYGGAHTPTDITGNITIVNNSAIDGFEVAVDANCKIIDLCLRLDLSAVGNKVSIDIPSGYVAVTSAYALRTLMLNTYGSNTTAWGTSAKVQATTTNAVNNTTYTSSELTLTNNSYAQLGLTATAKTKIEIEVTQACDGVVPYAVVTGQIFCHKE